MEIFLRMKEEEEKEQTRIKAQIDFTSNFGILHCLKGFVWVKYTKFMICSK